LQPGDFVLHAEVPGVARVAELGQSRLRIECFDSVSRPVAFEKWVAVADCTPHILDRETRVFWADPDTAEWHAGRIVGRDGRVYFVRLPNSESDVKIPGEQLRVRWDRPLADPVDVLAVGGNETGFFRDARLPLLRNLVAQRAACAGISALLSSTVEIFPHQVRAALTILGDPVQRYLLADEVGLGKTIEAGFVIRQTLIDKPAARIAVIAPDTLRRQWQRELKERFFVDDFPRAVLRIGAHETPGRWSDYAGFDLLVVDEAHRLVDVADPTVSPYAELVAVAHSTPRVLLLSATPVVWHEHTYLALLHLLDPHMYRWDRREDFVRRVEGRMALATAVYSMDAAFEQLLPTAIDEIAEIIPDDPRFRSLSDQVLALLDEHGDLMEPSRRDELSVRVDGLRAHLGETYRLDRRVIRNRRQAVLREAESDSTLPFGVTGRKPPLLLTVDDRIVELGHDLLLAWQALVAKDLLDRNAVDHAEAYGAVLGVLASRAGGSPKDLADTLRWRCHANRDSADRAGLSELEREILRSVPVIPGETDLPLEEDDSSDEETAIARTLATIARKHRRIIVFCGPGRLAHTVSGQLRPLGGLPAVEHTYLAGAETCERNVQVWSERGGLLIADDSADDGLNLQIADAVVHVRLPWSPNRLEQRLGRVDRYSQSGHKPARQILIASPAGNFTFMGAWSVLLRDGFGIFTKSISTLQAGIERVLPGVWRDALIDGPRALTSAVDDVRAALAQEQRDIDAVDMLDAIYESTSGPRDIPEAIGQLETGWRTMQAALSAYAGGGPGGLRLSAHKAPNESVMRYGRGPVPPLVSPRLLARGGEIGGQTTTGAFNRSVALRLPGTRLFRIGNPLVDLLADVLAIDDRGQASVYWRLHHTEAQAFFGFDYLIDADISAAVALAGPGHDRARPLRRQADRLLAPFMMRVWVQVAGQVVADAALAALLDHPYNPQRDININFRRTRLLLDYFGAQEQYIASARMADSVGRRYTLESPELTGRVAAAAAAATHMLTVTEVQAQARRAAGRILDDTESMLSDMAVTASLTQALQTPRIRTVSVTCCILGRPPAGVDVR